MKERISVAFQGLLIVLFGLLCIFRVEFELIGSFFVGAGVLIGIIAIFGKIQSDQAKQ